MADQNDPNKATGSPWEEVLDVVEDTKPKVFGTLDNGGNPTATPGDQLKVPTNIHQGIGDKLPAEQVAAKNSIIQNPAPQSASSAAAPIQHTPPTTTAAPISVGLGQPSQSGQGGVAGQPVPKQPTPISAGAPAEKPNQALKNHENIAATPESVPANPVVASAISQPPGLRKSSVSANLAKPIQEWLAKPKVIIVAIIVVLLVGLTYFNETGVFSSGLEKVYGIFRLEALWGGLPADSQLALSQSFQKMQTEKSLKLDSEIKFTVNKSSESNITQPLLSLKNNPIYIIALQKAVLASSATSSVITQDDQDATEIPTESPTVDAVTDSTSVNSDSASDSTTDQTTQTSTTTSTSSDSQTDQGTSASSTSNLTTVKEFSSSGKSYLSTEGATSQMEITDESGKKNDVSLYTQNSRLYVNSTGVDYSGSSKGWVYFPLTSSNSQEILPAVFNKTNLSGFSVTGKRIGSGKFNGEPVYRYQVNIKIGSLFENIGVTDEMVNSITGEIDISKKDQLIRYAELTITPSISSAITRIDAKVAFSDYNLSQSLTFPENATPVGTDQTSTQTTQSTTTALPYVAPSTTSTSSTASPDLFARDAQRKADLKSIELALISYFATNNKYPSTGGVEIQTRTPGNVLAKVLVPAYFTSLPVDPWTDKYYYGYKSDGNSYELNALLGNLSDTDGTIVGGNNLYIIRH